MCTSSSPSDWTNRCNEQFSLQPSYFSPLYSTYKQMVDREMRKQLATNLLAAHNDLANEVEGYDVAQITAATRHRIKEMQSLAEELRSLSQRTNIPSCPNRNLALGFYSLLEEESHGRDSDAEVFNKTAQGHGNVWEHWKKHFADEYARSPSLEAVHVLYSRHDPGSTGPQAALDQEASKSSPGRYNPSMKVSLSNQGVASAVGMRKSSVAYVSIAPGQGRMFINDKPYDEVLKDPGLRLHFLRPFIATETMGRFDVVARVSGGGPSSISQALQHGIAQALTALVGARTNLKGMVQRDIRRVERKKPGRVKARKGFAYVRR